MGVNKLKLVKMLTRVRVENSGAFEVMAGQRQQVLFKCLDSKWRISLPLTLPTPKLKDKKKKKRRQKEDSKWRISLPLTLPTPKMKDEEKKEKRHKGDFILRTLKLPTHPQKSHIFSFGSKCEARVTQVVPEYPSKVTSFGSKFESRSDLGSTRLNNTNGVL